MQKILPASMLTNLLNVPHKLSPEWAVCDTLIYQRIYVYGAFKYTAIHKYKL